MATKQVAYSKRRALCQELYQYCLIPNDQFKFETHFTKIYEIIDQINEEEKNIPLCVKKVRTHLDFENFLKFLKENNCEVEKNIKIEKTSQCENDFSVSAVKSYAKGDLVFSIPENLILTINSLGENRLKQLAKEDKMLSSMPNVALALTMLYIKQNNDSNEEFSKWSSYMNILPSEFNTPLYFSLDEIKSLKNSQSFADIIFHIRNISRIYAYTINLLESKEEFSKFYNNFSFENFRWAVSVVSTRQNQIHDENNKSLLAMIPLLDMCNHEEGQFCTDYDDKTRSALCYAQKDFKTGDQITIFYGSRTNLEMLIHNGFVCEKNKHDCVKLKLSVSNEDVLFEKRSDVLKKYKLNATEVFEWNENCHSYEKLLPRLFVYIKIFISKTEADLEAIQNDEAISEEEYFNKSDLFNDQEIRQFLKIRLTLLIKSTEMSSKKCLKTTNGIFIGRLLDSEQYLLKIFLDFVSNQ
uniref:protein-histidine N-methyltransferase n=1 Tax=Brachionus koreanus TaxID=1199090 RepID=A0A4Y6ERC2_9BILA|nr:histone-lysine N-methyltransferase setd3 isoform X1 [Brachionus koreanus]